MSSGKFSFQTLFIFFGIVNCAYVRNKNSLKISLPGVAPEKPDTYLCIAAPLGNVSGKQYIVEFEPVASMQVIHHMMLFGCRTPGILIDGAWQCGNGHSSMHMQGLPNGPICGTVDSQIVYAWARNASKLTLPKGVAFEVGGSSPVQHLVLQFHYPNIDEFKGGKKDYSGLNIRFCKTPQPKKAGVFVITSSYGILPPMSLEHADVLCQVNVNEGIKIHSFRFRTHTHDLGKVVSGFHVRQDRKSGVDKWTLIGKKDPMEPQMFYPVANKIVMKKGNILAARCTYYNSRNTTTHLGSSHTDEMCNFYVMFWSNIPFKTFPCSGPGPPLFNWKSKAKLYGLKNIPSYEETDVIK